mmetsp:Transcript_34668/g.53095  ORF Transcript_34668/g.53095 Transcript_34668/m.53095 type:complete len:118 (+) Transcript_34668:2286-2639(+)
MLNELSRSLRKTGGISPNLRYHQSSSGSTPHLKTSRLAPSNIDVDLIEMESTSAFDKLHPQTSPNKLLPHASEQARLPSTPQPSSMKKKGRRFTFDQAEEEEVRKSTNSGNHNKIMG